MCLEVCTGPCASSYGSAETGRACSLHAGVQRARGSWPDRVRLSQLLAWAAVHGSSGLMGSVQQLYMVGTATAPMQPAVNVPATIGTQAVTGAESAAHEQSAAESATAADEAARAAVGVEDTIEAVAVLEASDPAAPSAADAVVSGYVMDAPGLIAAIQAQSAGSSAASTGGGSGSSTTAAAAAAGHFTSLTEEQQQQAALAVAAASMAVVQNPDGSVALVTDLQGSLTVEQAAAAAVVPASEWCDQHDLALQRRLASVDAGLAARLSEAWNASSRGAAAAAATAGLASTAASAPQQQEHPAAPAGSAAAAAAEASSTPLGGEDLVARLRRLDEAYTQQEQQHEQERHGAAGNAGFAAAGDDFAERLRQLDEAYAQALQRQLEGARPD